MIGKAKDNMNDHPIFLKKEKVGVLRFSVVSREVDSRTSLVSSGPSTHSPQFNAARMIKSSTFHSNRKERPDPVEGKEKGGSHIGGPLLSQSIGAPGGGRSVTPPPDSVAHQSRRVRVREKRLSAIAGGNRKISKSVFPSRCL